MRFFQNANYPFLAWRKRAYIVSGIVLLLGIGSMAFNAFRTGSWLNYGVDFTGGTIVQVDFRRPTTVEEIRSTAAAAGHSDWQIIRFGTADEFIVRMPSFAQGGENDAQGRVAATLAERYPADSYSIVRTEAVGPKVGAELQQRALLAILLSFLATLGYLGMRFEWRFGAAAIVATAHDILITLGFLAIFRYEISLGTVAALLTIVGYSLNDTIVVFDRIRENLARPRRMESFLAVLTESINETLPRTVLTAMSTLGTLLALVVFGGPVIRDFSVVLILGIIIGTFSSIFVASPALYEIERRWPRYMKQRAGRSAKPAVGRVGTAV